MSVEELVTLLNEHLETRMFLVGNSVTAADIIVLAHLAGHFVSLSLSKDIH